LPSNRYGWWLGKDESRALDYFLRAAHGDSSLIPEAFDTLDGRPTFENVLRRIFTLRAEKDALA
jgi:hypothetical protein